MPGSKRHLLVLSVAFCGCGQEALIVLNNAGSGSPTGQRSITSDGGSTSVVDCAISPDMAGCPCATPYEERSCYPADAPAGTRSVGACHDGTQMCQRLGEGWAFGPCLGARTPTAELCSDKLDDNCDGRAACEDPSCAVNPACVP